MPEDILREILEELRGIRKALEPKTYHPEMGLSGVADHVDIGVYARKLAEVAQRERQQRETLTKSDVQGAVETLCDVAKQAGVTHDELSVLVQEMADL